MLQIAVVLLYCTMNTTVKYIVGSRVVVQVVVDMGKTTVRCLHNNVILLENELGTYLHEVI